MPTQKQYAQLGVFQAETPTWLVYVIDLVRTSFAVSVRPIEETEVRHTINLYALMPPIYPPSVLTTRAQKTRLDVRTETNPDKLPARNSQKYAQRPVVGGSSRSGSPSRNKRYVVNGQLTQKASNALAAPPSLTQASRIPGTRLP